MKIFKIISLTKIQIPFGIICCSSFLNNPEGQLLGFVCGCLRRAEECFHFLLPKFAPLMYSVMSTYNGKTGKKAWLFSVCSLPLSGKTRKKIMLLLRLFLFSYFTAVS